MLCFCFFILLVILFNLVENPDLRLGPDRYVKFEEYVVTDVREQKNFWNQYMADILCLLKYCLLLNTCNKDV